MELSERIFFSYNWTTILLVISFIILAVLRQTYPRRFVDLLSLPVSGKFLNVHGKEDRLPHSFNLTFFIFQIINVAILLRFVSVYLFGTPPGDTLLLLRIVTLYCVFVLGKVLVEKIIGNVFSIESFIDTYLYEKLAYRNFLSLFIFIGNLIFLYAFTPSRSGILFFVAAIILGNILSLLSLFRRNWKSINFYFLYFILYLCALEISPYIILYYLFFK